MTDGTFEASLVTALLAAIPLLYASLGELLGQRVGVFNIGIDGVMLMGAVGGYITATKTGSVALGLLTAAVVGCVFNLVFLAVPVLSLRLSPVLVGFAVWFMGAGLSAQLGRSYVSTSLEATTAKVEIPGLGTLPVVGKVFFGQPWPGYLAVLLSVCAALFFSRTRYGLDMRAIGDDPASAHAAGVPVLRWQYAALGMAGTLVGLGGGVLSVAIAHGWRAGMTAGRGWIALALVIFAGWRALSLLWATYLFGVLLTLTNLGQALGWPVASEFLAMAPYLVTVAVLGIRTWREQRRTGPSLAPAALGSVFVRGERR